MKSAMATILTIIIIICCSSAAFADTVKVPIDISTMDTSDLLALDEFIHKELTIRDETPFTSQKDSTSTIIDEEAESNNDIDTMNEGETTLSDESFLSDLSAGLVARWAVANQDTNIMSDKQVIEYFSMLVNSELAFVSKYSGYSFTDEKLGNYAHAYINALNSQLIAITEYKGKDESLYSQYWDESYSNRTRYIYLINKEYGLNIPSTYSSILAEMVEAGMFFNYKSAVETAISNECLGIDLEFDTSSTGYLYVKPFNFVNTSIYEIENLTVMINFINEKNVIVDSEYLISYKSVSAGKSISTQKAMTSNHFVRISFSYSFTIQTNVYYETCENIVMPTIQYSWDGMVKKNGELAAGQPILEIKDLTTCWEMNTSWNKTLYVPVVKFDVVNTGTGDAEKIVVRVVFTNQKTKQIWDEETTYVIGSSDTPLRTEYSKKVFVYSTVGYKTKVTPPDLTADIYINNQLITSQTVSN